MVAEIHLKLSIIFRTHGDRLFYIEVQDRPRRCELDYKFSGIHPNIELRAWRSNHLPDDRNIDRTLQIGVDQKLQRLPLMHDLETDLRVRRPAELTHHLT